MRLAPSSAADNSIREEVSLQSLDGFVGGLERHARWLVLDG